MEAVWGAPEWAGACRLVLLAMPSPPDILASDPPMRLVLCRAQRVLCAGGDPGDKEVLPTAACWLGDQADGFVVRGCRGRRREGWSRGGPARAAYACRGWTDAHLPGRLEEAAGRWASPATATGAGGPSCQPP